MKGFIISLVLFAVIIAAVCVNAAYVKRVATEMKELAEAVIDKNSSDTEVSELKGYWERHRDIVGLSANYKLTDTVSEELLKLEAAHTFGNRLALEQSYAILCDVLEDIAQYERISFGSIS